MADHVMRFMCCAGPVTFTATTAITGGSVVEVTGDRSVGTAGAASTKVVGTAGHDASVGDTVAVNISRCIDTVVAAGVIAAGDGVEAAAAGQVQKLASGTSLGIALTAAGAAGVTVQVLRA